MTLLIPTLNEFSGVSQIMPHVQREWVDQILFVDGGSTDGTIELVKSMNYEILIQKKKGIRYAYIEALDHIRGDAILTFSPDGNSIPSIIPPLIQKFNEGYDMVIASRYLGDAKSEDDDIITAFGNWLFTSLINHLHGGTYTDAMVMYRIYRKNLLYELDINKDSSYQTEEKLFRTVVGCEPLISIRAAKRKLKFAEIPADEPKRIGNERKLKIIRWGCAYMYEVFREKFFWS